MLINPRDILFLAKSPLDHDKKALCANDQSLKTGGPVVARWESTERLFAGFWPILEGNFHYRSPFPPPFGDEPVMLMPVRNPKRVRRIAEGVRRRVAFAFGERQVDVDRNLWCRGWDSGTIVFQASAAVDVGILFKIIIIKKLKFSYLKISIIYKLSFFLIKN